MAKKPKNAHSDTLLMPRFEFSRLTPQKNKPRTTQFFRTTLRAVLINGLIRINPGPKIVRSCFLHCAYHHVSPRHSGEICGHSITQKYFAQQIVTCSDMPHLYMQIVRCTGCNSNLFSLNNTIVLWCLTIYEKVICCISEVGICHTWLWKYCRENNFLEPLAPNSCELLN